MSALLQIENLQVTFNTRHGQVTALDSVSLSVNAGETLGVVGESGCGKSITALSVMGLIPMPPGRIAGGSIKLNGEELVGASDARLRGLRGSEVAMIFQEPMTSLNPVFSIGDQIAEAIMLHQNVSYDQAFKDAVALLDRVGIPSPDRRARDYPHQLSGGMRQRVMIAMAVSCRPKVLIADEPTTALDVTVQREVLDLLRVLTSEMGMALILITHDMGVVAEMADRVLVMQKGQLVEEAAVRTLFRDPKMPYTQQLLSSVPRMGKGRVNTVDTTVQPLLSVRDLKVTYDIRGGILDRVQARVHAVEKVNFDIFPGETFAVVGESGCGKSTIARALTGLVPHEGVVKFSGKPILRDRSSQRTNTRAMQMVFQDPMAALNGRMTVGDLVKEPMVIHEIGTPQSRTDRAAELFKRVGLGPEALDRYPHEFSGGQRQRICIARALALNPKLIVADESVSALDVSVQATVLDLLQELKSELGMSYLFISHDMAVVENIADRVAVMYLGQIVEIGTSAQVFGNPQHQYTRRLIAAAPFPDPERQIPINEVLGTELKSPVMPIGQSPQILKYRAMGDGHLVAV